MDHRLNFPQFSSQRGEVAWFLTVISMLTVALGLVIGINTTTSEQALTQRSDAFANDTHRGKPVGRTDGIFISTGGVCGVTFDTQIDPRISDIIITRPPTKGWPAAGADTFALVDQGGATGIRDLIFNKNYTFRVRFNPADPDKNTPNPNDILVTYKVPSQPDKTFIIDQSKVPSWVRDANTEVILVFAYVRSNPPKYFYTSATSTACPGAGTPTLTTTVTPPTDTPTVTTTTTPTPGVCYDLCQTDAQCGQHVDPTTGVNGRMKCLEKAKSGPAFNTAYSTSFFTEEAGASQNLTNDDFPFYAESMIVNDDYGKTSDHQFVYSDISPAGWTNSDNVSGPFRRNLYPDDATKDPTTVKWSTDSVPASVRNREFSVTLTNLPAKYEIVSKFCDDTSFGNEQSQPSRPDVCGDFNEKNGPSTDKNTVYGLKILKNGAVEYGWNIRLRRAGTTAPTVTTTPQPTPEICSEIISRVPAAVIGNATANPGSITGWGQAKDPSKPVSTSNPLKTKLDLISLTQPYHPTSNTVVYKATCSTPPATPPTVTPGPLAGGHAPCDPSKGVECRCMPTTCTRRDCSTRALACEKAETTPTVTPPTPTKPPVEACVYNALAFVEECKKEDINPATGECLPLPGTNRLKASPIANVELEKTDPVWKMWAPMNNRQAANPRRPESQKPSLPQQFNYLQSTHPVFFHDLLNRFPFFNFGNNKTEGISISPRQFSSQDVVVPNVRDLLNPSLGIKILSDAELTRALPASADRSIYIPAEQHNNMEDTNVKLFFDQNNYRIVPNGKNIYSCTNSIARRLQAEGKLDSVSDADLIKMTSGVGACDMAEFEKFKPRDTIGGLTVGCGQDIVYGWTLQKCTFDYDIVFVVDTSTSMGKSDPNLGGQRKIDGAIDQIETFMNAIEQSGSDSRVALVNFNNAVHVYKDGTGNAKDLKDSDGDGFGNGIRTKGMVSKNDFNSVRAQLSLFKKTKAEGGYIEKGSCQKCGMDLAAQILHGKRSEDEKKARQGVVIILTDGLPNSYAGDAAPEIMAQYPPEARGNVEPWSWTGIYKSADELRNDGATTPSKGVRAPGRNANVFDDVLLIAIALGDEKKKEDEGSDFQQFTFSVASERANSNDRWAFSTDPMNASPISIREIFSAIQKDLNTCALSTLAFDISQKARDINNDRIINTIDLFLIYDKYYQKGDDIAEDVNADSIVNALDVSLVLQSSGTVVTSSQ